MHTRSEVPRTVYSPPVHLDSRSPFGGTSTPAVRRPVKGPSRQRAVYLRQVPGGTDDPATHYEPMRYLVVLVLPGLRGLTNSSSCSDAPARAGNLDERGQGGVQWFMPIGSRPTVHGPRFVRGDGRIRISLIGIWRGIQAQDKGRCDPR